MSVYYASSVSQHKSTTPKLLNNRRAGFPVDQSMRSTFLHNQHRVSTPASTALRASTSLQFLARCDLLAEHYAGAFVALVLFVATMFPQTLARIIYRVASIIYVRRTFVHVRVRITMPMMVQSVAVFSLEGKLASFHDQNTIHQPSRNRVAATIGLPSAQDLVQVCHDQQLRPRASRS